MVLGFNAPMQFIMLEEIDINLIMNCTGNDMSQIRNKVVVVSGTRSELDAGEGPHIAIASENLDENIIRTSARPYDAKTYRGFESCLLSLPSWQAWRESSSVSSSINWTADCGELGPDSRPPGFITIITSIVNSPRSQREYIHTIPRWKYSEAISNTGSKSALSISTPAKRILEELLNGTLWGSVRRLLTT